MVDVHAVKNRHSDDLLHLRGVTGVFVDDAAGEIVVSVKSGSNQGHIPEAVEGVPIRVEVRDITLDSAEPQPDPREETYRPVPLGVRMEGGSTGFLVTDGDSHFLLTNRHVLDGNKGVAVRQPDNGDIIGTLAGFVPYETNTVDAAWSSVEFGGAINYCFGVGGYPEGPIYQPSQGDSVIANGGQSGTHEATIALTDGSIMVGGQPRNGILATERVVSIGGDSGGQWLHRDGQGRLRPVGLNFASSPESAYAIDLDSIIAESNLEIVTGPVWVPPDEEKKDWPNDAVDVRERTETTYRPPGWEPPLLGGGVGAGDLALAGLGLWFLSRRSN